LLQPKIKKVSFFAPVKINLSLQIIGRRHDGFHLLESLVVFADKGDELSVSKSDSLTLKIKGPFAGSLSTDKNNLVMRAATLLAEFHKIEPKAHIELNKNIPVSSGLGGGSADAAATLHALTELWKLPISDQELNKIARLIGSDVSVCLNQKSAIIEGIGERVSRLGNLPKFGILLVNSNSTVSTQKVFQKYHGNFSVPGSLNNIPKDRETFHKFLRDLHNDLTQASIYTAPEIKNILSVLTELDNQLLVRLTGSGGTCFALFDGIKNAQEAAEKLKIKFPGWWIEPASILT
tara:strand:+ start:23486 stop:24361 length:876 start_codon:yes stop_codon:yes gene_type:complete